MVRRGFRGGGFGGRRSFSGRSRSVGSDGRRRSTSGTGRARRSGSKKTSQSDVVAYSIYNSRGKRTYVGSTNNPERRAAQHAKNGKLKRGGKLVVESGPMSRGAAQHLEAKKIQGYRRRTGRIPAHNKTSDGQYYHRRS